MRVIHVVTLVSGDGAFGGPLRVALNDVRELRRRGHHVDLVAGWRGPSPAPTQVDGVAVTLFRAVQAVPGAGFSGLVSPGLLRWLSREARLADVVHVHAGRDGVTLPALAVAQARGAATVVQTHGMVAVDGRLKSRVLDSLATRRLLARASQLLALTDAEERDLPRVAGRPVEVRRIRNGVDLEPARPGGAPPDAPDVLYCARLHARKRPVAFVEAAALVLQDHPTARFALVGPDEGQLPAVRTAVEARGLGRSVTYEGALPYDRVTARMARSSVYVLPSVDEPFPMSLLEALALGLPCVITDSTGISAVLAERGAALVTDGSPAELAAAVGRFLDDPGLRGRTGAAALDAVREVFSLSAVVDDLEDAYRTVATPDASREAAR